MISQEELISSLMETPDLIKYLTFEINPTKSTKSFGSPLPSPSLLEIIGKLTNFFNYTLLGNRNFVSPEIPHYPSLSREDIIAKHQLIFLAACIRQYNVQDRDAAVKKLAKMLETLQSLLFKIEGVTIKVSEEQLMQDLQRMSEKTQRLVCRFNFIKKSLDEKMKEKSEPEHAKAEVRGVISVAAAGVDPTTSFLHPSELQSRFEAAILSESLPYSDLIGDIAQSFPIVSGNVFIMRVFDSVSVMLTDMSIQIKHADSALVILLFRTLFDRVFLVNPYFQEPCEDLIQQLSNITVEDLGLPLEYCPVMNLSSHPRDIFRTDQYFSNAVWKLEQISFFTNPFDILNCIHETLTVIEGAATHYSGGDTLVFPFEVTFGLFLAVVLSCQIPRLQSIADFVDNYSPQFGLCPSFEYARAKIIACSVQCQEIIANGPNNNTD